MIRILTLLGVLTFLTGSAFAQQCPISGTVPDNIRRNICDVAQSVNGGDAPVNQLTVVLKRAPALAVAAGNLDARDFMMALLNSWMSGRGVEVARVEAYSTGQSRIAVAETRIFGAPRVTFD